MKDLFKLAKFAIPYKKHVLLNIGFNLLYVLFALFSFSLLAPFLDILFSKSTADFEKIATQQVPIFQWSKNGILNFLNYKLAFFVVSKGKLMALIYVCILVWILTLLKNLFRYLALYVAAPIRMGVTGDLRNKIYAKILALPLSFYSQERKGDLISRSTSDITDLEFTILQSIETLTREPLTIIIFLFWLLMMSPQLTIFVFVMILLIVGVIGKIGKSLKKLSLESKDIQGQMLNTLEETLGGIRIINAFNAQAFMKNKFNTINHAFNKILIKTYRRIDLASPVSETLSVAVLIGVMIYGGVLVLGDNATLAASTFISYIAIFSQLIPPAKLLTTAAYNAQKGASSIERINKILDADITIYDNEQAQEVTSFNNELKFDNVNFSYTRGDSGYVLKNINLTIGKGKTIALVGQSGSGKTTLADLIPRFHNINEGRITIDGTPIEKIKLNSLRGLMGIVNQDAILFNDTVANNISFGEDVFSQTAIEQAAKIANAHEFICQLENGYNTIIGDRGSKLSGGQRQRLSIARAILKNPAILILDEATSALDTESEKLVQDAIINLMKNRTSVVIAHRLSTIQNADEIIVLHQGEIIETGTHQSLIQKNGTYKKLYDLQSFN